MTNNSKGSDFVEKEILLAEREKKSIFPLLLQGDIFPILINKNYTDVRGGIIPSNIFFDDLQQVLTDYQLQMEWTILNGLREILKLGLQKAVSYQETLTFAESIDKHFDRKSRAIVLEDRDIAEYEQLATVTSLQTGKEITPLDLITDRINDIEKKIEFGRENNEPIDTLRRRLASYKTIRSKLTKKPQSFLPKISQSRKLLPGSNRGSGYEEFSLNNIHALRVKIDYPNNREWSKGLHVIYEKYLSEEAICLLHIHFAIWDGTDLSEYERLPYHGVFCNLVCKVQHKIGTNYRLPYCAFFIRPTDKLEKPDDLRSSNYHIRRCEFDNLTEQNMTSEEDFRKKALTLEPFVELFNNEMLGSRVISSRELTKLYDEQDILNPDMQQGIIIHAQEYHYKHES